MQECILGIWRGVLEGGATEALDTLESSGNVGSLTKKY